jgi:putative ABC transport system permease protein
MTFWTLIFRSLRFHARSHLGTLLGAAIGSAVLIGALVVGDSVRESLRERVWMRLGRVKWAMNSGDRFFREELANDLAKEMEPSPNAVDPTLRSLSLDKVRIEASLRFGGTVSTTDNSARVNHVQIIGAGENSHFLTPSMREAWEKLSRFKQRPRMLQLYWTLNRILSSFFGREMITPHPETSFPIAALNRNLSERLRAKSGDVLLLRVFQPSVFSREIVLSPQEDTAKAMRIEYFNESRPERYTLDFGLLANQAASYNLFLARSNLQERMNLKAKANLLLIPDDLAFDPNVVLRKKWQLADAQLELRELKALPHPGPLPKERKNSTPPQVSSDDSKGTRQSGDEAINREKTKARPNGPPLPGERAGEREDVPNPNQTNNQSLPRSEFPVPSWIELRSERIFLDEPISKAALSISYNATGILTYFVNELRVGTNTTPYSMVTAANAPIVPNEMRDDEILINQWLADDLQAKPGDELALRYFVMGTSQRLEERTNSFRIRAVVPMEGVYADRELMPEFPGIAKAEKTENWDAGFTIDMKKIRAKDEDYWKKFRGTPKTFVTLAAGQKMWANRFGNLTAVRFPSLSSIQNGGEGGGEEAVGKPLSPTLSPLVPRGERGMIRVEIESALLKKIDPASIGLKFENVREQALTAVSQSQDFAGLFLGLSFFLIAAALILMGLLFQFGLEQRSEEIGTLLALGFRPKQVRRIFLGEGILIAFLGGLLGALGGIAYAKGMLWALSTIWRSAVAGSAINFHVTTTTLAIGFLSSVIVSLLTIWLVLRKQAKQTAHELLGGDLEFQLATPIAPKRPWAEWIAIASGVSGIALIGWAIAKNESASSETFFSGGSLLLVAGLAGAAVLLKKLLRSGVASKLTIASLGLRGVTRRRKRSLATIALLASGTFLVVAVGAFRLESTQDATKRSSGTGGFAFIGETTLPVVQNLNDKAGREFFGLDEKDLTGVKFIPFRVHDGDEASCLNLNRAQRPRLLGVNPALLSGRFAFQTGPDFGASPPPSNLWSILNHLVTDYPGSIRSPAMGALKLRFDGTVPAIADAASIQWALGKKIGDTLDYEDERGHKFKLRLVGSLANSILQGSLIIDENAFLRLFPNETGYRMFLVDAPSNSAIAVSQTLSRALRDVGLELTPTTERLAAFNAVQNTYLSTFQILGGLGLLLGSAGLGVVVLRNVLERRGEMALLSAVGFRRRALRRLVMSEHAALLWLGLGIGMVSALLSILPALISPNAELPYRSLALTLAGIFASGMLSAWLATKWALRGELLKALRNE